MDAMKIYNRSPIWAQNILTSLQGYKYKKERYGEPYQLYLAELRRRDYQDSAKMKALQDRLVRDFVQYAFAHSPFYHQLYQGLDLSKIRSAGDLKFLPVLEKEMVRSHLANIYTITAADGIKANTSGTTGTSMTFLYTKADLQRRMAYLDFFKEQNGFKNLKMKRASFNSAKIVPPRPTKPVFWRDNLAVKQRIYSGYHCQGENLPYYVANLNQYQPQALDGYPSALYQLARYIIKNNLKLTFQPVAVFPTAETLLPHYQKMIEAAFNCPVLDQYASSEGAPFIIMCSKGKLHYCLDTGVIEIAGNGDMLVTCFETHGTPLIRYNIGDKVSLAPASAQCACGSCLPVVEKIDGRGHDFLVSKSHGEFPALYMSLVSEEFNNSVKAMQFIQNQLDEINVLLEVDRDYNESMNRIILDKLHYSLGDDMQIRLKLVERIPKEKSGKFRLIINNI